MSVNRYRVFLDTNVVFSGIYSADGAPGSILDECVRGKLDIVISRMVLDEVIRVFKEKLPRAIPLLTEFLLGAQPEVVPDPEFLEIEQWTKYMPVGDACIFTSAVAAEPDFFITGDNHFLENPCLKDLVAFGILTPAQFVKLLRGIDS